MTNPIDEEAVPQLKEFESIFDEDVKGNRNLTANIEPLTKLSKEVLGDQSEKAVVFSRMKNQSQVLYHSGGPEESSSAACHAGFAHKNASGVGHGTLDWRWTQHIGILEAVESGWQQDCKRCSCQ